MPNLGKYLKQSVTVRRRGSRDFYGEITYEDPVTLPARLEEKQNMVRNNQGTENLSTTRVMTVAELKVGDLVNGLEVAARESIVDISGRTLGWTTYL